MKTSLQIGSGQALQPCCSFHAHPLHRFPFAFFQRRCRVVATTVVVVFVAAFVVVAIAAANA